MNFYEQNVGVARLKGCRSIKVILSYAYCWAPSINERFCGFYYVSPAVIRTKSTQSTKSKVTFNKYN